MDWDDLKPPPPKAVTLGEDLKVLSVAVFRRALRRSRAKSSVSIAS